MKFRILKYVLLLAAFLLAGCRWTGNSRGPTPPQVTPTLAGPIIVPTIAAVAPSAIPATAVSPTSTPNEETVEPGITATAVAAEAVVANEPSRIEFPAGATTGTYTGNLDPYSARQYIFWAQAGQMVHITLHSTQESAGFSFYGIVDGQPLKRVENEVATWDDMLRFTQDFVLTVQTREFAEEYTLTLTIEPLPGATDLEIWPIVDASTGYIVGGTDNAGNWLPAEAALAPLDAGLLMQAYDDYFLQDLVTARVNPQQSPVCAQPLAAIDGEPELGEALLISGRWNSMPRLPFYGVSPEPYVSIVRAELLAAGLVDPVVNIESVTLVDLEGDGIDETIVVAQHVDVSNPAVAEDDYVLVLLRKIVNGAVVNLPLHADFYASANDLTYPSQYALQMVRDLNGDGVLDIVLRGERYEGRSLEIFSVDGDNSYLALRADCQP